MRGKTVTEQIELLELNLRVARLYVEDFQQKLLFKPCRTGKIGGCLLCKAKQWTLRKRYQ